MKTLIRKALVVAALCVGSASITPQVYAQHGLLREIYPNLNSTGDITSLTSNANYPNNPASVTVISEFEAPDSQGDLYGQRVRGYVEAPETGDYTLWISSDDQSQLFLSSSEQPENKVKVAEVFNYTGPRQWDAEPNQQSSPIHLDEGKRYYIEAIMVNGFGDSHLAVRWQLPDGTIEEPIPNERVYAELIRPTITRQPPNVTVAEGQPATFTVQVANRAPISYQWYRNDVAIPGATNASFSIPVTAVTDSSSRFQVRLFNDFATNGVASTIAFLTVNRDTTPPTIVSVQTSGESDLLTVTFSEPVDPTTGTDPANYTVLGGPQVLGASLDSSGRTVILKTTPMGIGQSYTVLINNVLDRSSLGNVIEPDTTADFAFGFSPLDSDLVYGKPESPGPSTRRTALTFSEIMYHPAPRTDARNVKFIEIYNSGATLESVGGYRITGAIDYTFPEGTFIPATNYAVVAAVPVDMQILYGLPKVYGPFTNDLPDSGTLRLRNRQGAVLLDLTYDSKEEWPVAPDGEGPSLVLARPSYGEADPRAWAGSQLAGGSPGKAEPVSANPYRGLVINEFLAHSSTQLNFVELYNYSSQPIDLSGVLITDSLNTNKFRIKNGTTIAPFGFVSFDEIDLEFALSAGGERLIVRNPQQTRVIDTIKFGAQANGLSTGRFPDGSPEFQVLSQPTPKGANSRPLLPGVVINEIMYNPISGNGDEEYVELYNRSATNVDLTGWRIGGGISFAFTQNTILAPGAYLAVAKNVDLLRTNHPGTLGTSNSVGNFNGNLSNSGDRVALERPEVIIATNATSHATNVYYVVVNEMKYGTGGHWPTWANGGGSSMELVDPNSNNAEAANWGDSDETQKSIWYTFERRGILDNGPTNNTAQTSPIRNLHIFLEGAGEALLDNVQVFRDGQPNVVSNPG
ncbi:MAG TPA: lamin tail domain-containing protein, partial [Verrucomicrobiae bacterium]|nr:lamin tail domain-containing protein [Verrucomicrobiae bacterium]